MRRWQCGVASPPRCRHGPPPPAPRRRLSSASDTGYTRANTLARGRADGRAIWCPRAVLSVGRTATACASFGRFGPLLLPLPCSIRPPLATAERLLYMMEAMLRANTELRKEAFVMSGREEKGGNLGRGIRSQDSGDSAKVATLEGRGKDYAGRFKYRPVRLQSARASCESSKGRKRNNNKGHGNKGGGRGAPASSGRVTRVIK